MHRVDAKLAEWTRLYEKLKEARARLKDAAEQQGASPPDLKAEVDQLQRKCGVALDELKAEYERVKAGDSSKDSR